MSLRITLISVRPGGAHDPALDAQVEQFLTRCGREWHASSRVFRTEKILLEWVAEEKKKGAAAFWMADLGGRSLTSEQFAERLQTTRESSVRHLMLAIGPASGWSTAARALAELRLSLSAMTLPHELARLVLAEQIYRAVTILQGHPYHTGHSSLAKGTDADARRS